MLAAHVVDFSDIYIYIYNCWSAAASSQSVGSETVFWRLTEKNVWKARR